MFRPHTSIPHIQLSAIVLALLLVGGCASQDEMPFPSALLRAEEPRLGLYEELHPGDTFEVLFRRTPELNTAVTVSPDGKVLLPIVGQLQAQGRTPEDLKIMIQRRCQTELRDPEVTVVVTGFQGRAVHVGGQVGAPTRIVLNGPTTPLEAVIQAGGALDTGNLNQVFLVRAVHGGHRRVFELDLAASYYAGHPSGHLRLQPSDVLIVPRSGVANLNRWVDQYIRRNLPVSVVLRPEDLN